MESLQHKKAAAKRAYEAEHRQEQQAAEAYRQLAREMISRGAIA